MAVKYITTIKRFVGLAADTKPTDVPVGSEYWAYDINAIYKCYDGTNWAGYEYADIVLPTTIDLNQAAGDYDLYTATGGSVYIVNFTLTLPAVDCSDDLTITGITVQSDMATVTELVTAAEGAVANLTASASFSYSMPFSLTTGKKIQLSITGGAADAATVCTVSCRYHPVTPAAYLAP